MNFRFKPPISGVTAAVGSLLGGFQKQKNEEIIDVDKDGTTLFKEDIIRTVLDELEKRRAEKAPLERQWTLNANFLMGNQYCTSTRH